jgi:uridine phosphorylase
MRDRVTASGEEPSPLARDDYEESSVFLPENLLREARRQRSLAEGAVPRVCVLDPDGDVVRHLGWVGAARRSPVWACYHTVLWETHVEECRLGIVGCAVGAPFAVLVAEELFASGCEFLVSVTSAGLIAPELDLPCLILIERALRGEGTSLAYVPPSPFAEADPAVMAAVTDGLAAAAIPYVRGATWTTDAPFRETATAIAAARAAGALAVEMEAAALYAFARAREKPVACFALVTNQMAQIDGDFEKGENDGVDHVLRVAVASARGWLGRADLHGGEAFTIGSGES